MIIHSLPAYLGNDHTIHERYVIQALSELGSPDPAAIKVLAGKPYYYAVMAFLVMTLVISAFYLGSWMSRNKEEPAGPPVAKIGSVLQNPPEVAMTKSAAVKTSDAVAMAPALLPAPELQNPDPDLQ